MECKLSGDRAYELFVSSDPFPLHSFLDDVMSGKIVCAPGYIIAVLRAFDRMCDNCDDGRYKGIRRKR